ncbi:ATPase [Catenovulum maritimum]|uniref:histidine kinase n=2 Tax=Catenovulum maritimum TaxID=1513271 RepID=A0A0J8GSY1_9ALTE|nr:ATPase [Catenovulum maritimum]
MPPKAMSSIRSNVIFMVLVISTVSLILAFVINGVFEVKQQKSTLASQAKSFADIIGFSASTNLLFGDPVSENARLTTLEIDKNIENIHIYRINEENGKVEFFASYNKVNTPPIPTKINKLKELSDVTYSDNYLELIRGINFEGNEIGYIYVRFSLAQLKEQLYSTLYLKLLVLLISLGIALVLALRLQNSLTKPIKELVEVFKYVSKEKDYSVRAPKQSLIELNALSTSFNTMLDRIQAYLEKQAEAEKQIRKLNQSLEDKVGQRTDALKDANVELMSTLETLHQYQNQLVETEKMASLGDMVAGIAHEVNTPIGLGVTASTLLMDRIKDIREVLDNKKLTAGHLDRFLTEGHENLNIIYRNLNRAAELISSFKQVAVDQSSENDRVFLLSEFLKDVLLSLRPKLKHHEHIINVECDEKLTIESKPGPLNQIFINLIMNSVIHGFEFIEKGTITISMEATGNRLKILYRDNGKGVNEQLRKKIFDPFVTTKRGEGGSGLGMHLVYNLVTQALGGNITVASEEGKGIEFDISIPVNVKKVVV